MTPGTTSNPSYVGARADLLALMADLPKQRTLDVGCAEGALGAELKAHAPDASVTGVELDPAMAACASERLDRVLNVDAMTALDTLVAERAQFDVVCCGDVLEHLEDPWSALRKIRRLCPLGRVIVSLPNVGHWTTLWNLGIRGTWPHRDRGIHDRTHLRFFARNDLRSLFGQAGFEVVSIQVSHRLFERPGRWSRLFGRCLGWIPFVGRFTAYQFLCTLR